MNRGHAVPWELGADFEWPGSEFLKGGAQAAPWAQPSEAVTYVESGRQALALVSSHLRSRGFTTLLMPEHFCESMLDPFVRDGWSVDFVAVDQRWQCVVPEVEMASPECTLVFTMSYFGVAESDAWIRFLKACRAVGAKVLSDETHRLLSPGCSEADYRIGSLRKMLPVPDGAFITGFGPEVGTSGAQGERRVEAMRVKANYLAGLSEHRHLPLFAAAEAETEQEIWPASMSADAHRLVKSLDFAGMAAARAANHARLEARLPELGIELTTAGTSVASHAVITADDVQLLRRHLIAHRIYCPIHWPRPNANEGAPNAWRDNVLSIPIDHRYEVTDMDRVVDVIAAYLLERTA